MEKQRDKLARRAQRKLARQEGTPLEGDIDTPETDEFGELVSEPGQSPEVASEPGQPPKVASEPGQPPEPAPAPKHTA